MTTFVHRYELDPSRPDGTAVARDLAVRAFAPAAAWWCLLVGLGLLVVGPLGDLPAGDPVETWFADRRTPVLNTVSEWVGHLGATQVVIGVTVLTVAVLWWRTRQWWFALVPALAVALQSLVFVTASAVVGRERPDVPHLDDAPPTSSFPSGHTGASTALWLTLALLAQRIRHPVLRVVVTALCVLVPLLVGISRMYRGMHGPADVALGLVNGAVCVVLAWGYLRRSAPGRP
ncbi:phosphatase PAP2 family protein [Isoptericola sp. S6320L]|uniref:phosphatase PAP2 family protein n=1 Tax=Isoptericola sp. S6320L TaxID=2926411 RepID=UPI001FF3B7CE|nr:phosphatase PAP2 family protein [Isoptericola sp. S6320L]MCK0116810.1 phosphatase PAP2 family protein [Isoptericola sp. S6320L]